MLVCTFHYFDGLLGWFILLGLVCWEGFKAMSVDSEYWGQKGHCQLLIGKSHYFGSLKDDMRLKNQTLNLLICVQIRYKVISVRNSLSAQPLYCLNTDRKIEGSGKCWFGSCAHQPHPSWRLTGLCRPGAQLLLATAENLSPWARHCYMKC